MIHKLICVPLILILTGCGQPGPLYLPTKAPIPVKPKPDLKKPNKDN
jgi:predicted small lipoprotein YifL